MALFKKVASNSDKMDEVEAKITKRIESLSAMLSEITVKMEVSSASSEKDLVRMDKMLKSLLTELSAEQIARREGDATAESAIMSRVQVLIQELTAQQEMISAEESSKEESSKCVCNIVEENGVTTTKCVRDGEEVPSCGIEGWKPPPIGGGSSSSSSTSSKKTSSSSSSTSGGTSSKSSCKCKTSIADGEVTTVCEKDGVEVPKSECGMSDDMGMENMEDLIKKAKGGEASSSSSSSSSSTESSTTGGTTEKSSSSSSSSSKCSCEMKITNGDFTEVCHKDGTEVPKSECPGASQEDVDMPKFDFDNDANNNGGFSMNDLD